MLSKARFCQSYFWLTIVLLFACLPQDQSAVAAEDQKENSLKANLKSKWLLAQHSESGGTGEAAWQLLKQPLDLPDLPKYGGHAEFIDGLMYPNKPGGPAVTLHYKVKEAPSEVLNWYADALKNYQWILDRGRQTANSTSVSGKHGKNGCTITVSHCKEKGYPCDLRISFKITR